MPLFEEEFMTRRESPAMRPDWSSVRMAVEIDGFAERGFSSLVSKREG